MNYLNHFQKDNVILRIKCTILNKDIILFKIIKRVITNYLR